MQEAGAYITDSRRTSLRGATGTLRCRWLRDEHVACGAFVSFGAFDQPTLSSLLEPKSAPACGLVDLSRSVDALTPLLERAEHLDTWSSSFWSRLFAKSFVTTNRTVPPRHSIGSRRGAILTSSRLSCPLSMFYSYECSTHALLVPVRRARLEGRGQRSNAFILSQAIVRRRTRIVQNTAQ